MDFSFADKEICPEELERIFKLAGEKSKQCNIIIEELLKNKEIEGDFFARCMKHNNSLKQMLFQVLYQPSRVYLLNAIKKASSLKARIRDIFRFAYDSVLLGRIRDVLPAKLKECEEPICTIVAQTLENEGSGAYYSTHDVEYAFKTLRQLFRRLAHENRHEMQEFEIKESPYHIRFKKSLLERLRAHAKELEIVKNKIERGEKTSCSKKELLKGLLCLEVLEKSEKYVKICMRTHEEVEAVFLWSLKLKPGHDPFVLDHVFHPETVLRRGEGDCDDVAALIASMLGSLGVDSWVCNLPAHVLACPLVPRVENIGDCIVLTSSLPAPVDPFHSRNLDFKRDILPLGVLAGKGKLNEGYLKTFQMTLKKADYWLKRGDVKMNMLEILLRMNIEAAEDVE